MALCSRSDTFQLLRLLRIPIIWDLQAKLCSFDFPWYLRKVWNENNIVNIAIWLRSWLGLISVELIVGTAGSFSIKEKLTGPLASKLQSFPHCGSHK